MKLFVEGGGDIAALKSECRRGFENFLDAAGLQSKPRIVSCGTRRNAYEQFCFAKAVGETAYLLVDSETRVAVEDQSGQAQDWRPWRHLKARSGDGWDEPAGANDLHCHLMVQCMENWIIADMDALSRFFGQGFAPKLIPKSKTIESIDKSTTYAALANATKACRTKSPYGKGKHSFKLLASLDPSKVAAASPWAERFVTTMKSAMDA